MVEKLRSIFTYPCSTPSPVWQWFWRHQPTFPEPHFLILEGVLHTSFAKNCICPNLSGGCWKNWHKLLVIVLSNLELTQGGKTACNPWEHCKSTEQATVTWGKRLWLKYTGEYPKHEWKTSEERLSGKVGYSKTPVYTEGFRKVHICPWHDTCSEKTWENPKLSFRANL